MNVVEQQRRGATVAGPPPVHVVAVDRRDQLVDERLGREAGHDRTPLPRQLEPDGVEQVRLAEAALPHQQDRKSTRLNSSHSQISYAVFCLKKKTKTAH